MIKETLIAFDYEVYEEKTSLIDPSKKIRTLVGIRCPYCSVIGKVFRHSEFKCCDSCGLEMILYGNALTCILKNK